MPRWLAGVVCGVLCALAAYGDTYEYDQLGRVVRAVYDDGSVIEYDYDENDNRSHLGVTPSSALIYVDDASIAEGGDLQFVIRREGALTTNFTVEYATDTEGLTAQASDFGAVSDAVTFAVGEESEVIIVPTIEDASVEGHETLRLVLSDPTNEAVIMDGEAIGTIYNDDVHIAVGDVSADEGDPLEFTITRTGVSNLNHVVSYATAADTAESDDFAATSGTVTFAPGQNVKTVQVSTSADLVHEFDDVVHLNLSDATNGATITDAQGVGAIVNDDPSPRFRVDDADGIEGEALGFALRKVGETEKTHAITFQAQTGTAQSADFVAASGSYSFAPGQFVQTAPVFTVDDEASESNETVLLILSAPTNGATIEDSQGEGVIFDDDVANQAPVANDDSTTATSGTPRTVNVLINDSDPEGHALTITAVTQPTHGAASIASGGAAVSYTGVNTEPEVVFDLFTYTVTDIRGGSATASVALALSGSGGSVGPTFSVSSVPAVEGNNLIFTVTKTGATSQSHTVSYSTTNGTAAAGFDYTTKSGTLTFASGQTTKTVSVVTAEDGDFEADETVLLNLAWGTSANHGVGVIENKGPEFSVNDVSVSEGGNLSFTIIKAGSTTQSHNVSYATAGWEAVSGQDYNGKSGTLTFGPSDTSKTVTVTTIEDAVYEVNERMRLNLSSATNGATIADSQGVGTINNDDTGPAFSVSNASVSEGGNLSFTVTKSGATSQSHNVSYETANGTATTSDYTPKSGTLTFASGETSKTVTVATIEDATYETSETVLLELSSPTNGATIADSQGVGTINNDDAGPAFSVNDVSISEGGTLSFTVTKTGSTSKSHNVSYATTNGTAAAGSDYTAKSGTLTFASGETSKTVTVATIEDALNEPTETVLLDLSSATNGAMISDSRGVGTINDDDTGPAFSVNNVSVSEGGNLTFTVTKSGTASQSHNVSYATANGTAAAGSDYTAKSGTLTFTSGETSKTVSVATIEDSLDEPNETVLLNLSSATNGATISDGQGVGTINDDDLPNEEPVANPDSTSAISGVPITVSVLANDSDPDGDPLIVTSVTQPTHGSASIIGGGTAVSYTGVNPDPFFVFDLFTYTISDGRGGTDTANVQVALSGGL